MLLPDWPPDAAMQDHAAELALPQTGFVVATPGGTADYAIRWFGPTAEVALCGHATLAAGHVLPGAARLRFATRQSGTIVAERDGERTRIALPRIEPAPAPLPAVVSALRCPPPVATLWEPRGYAVVVLADESAVRRTEPDFPALAALGGISTIVTAPGDDSDIVSRVFVPAYGTPEDAVTGSAHAAVASYWAERLGLTGMSAVQASERGGRLHCRVDGERVWLSGCCAVEKTSGAGDR